MSKFIDQQMSENIAKDEARKQVNCQHTFETRYIEFLDENIEICSKCDINKRTYLLSLDTSCFGHSKWYYLKCCNCILSYLCQAKKELKI